jgi:uncharacterized membrane protein
MGAHAAIRQPSSSEAPPQEVRRPSLATVIDDPWRRSCLAALALLALLVQVRGIWAVQVVLLAVLLVLPGVLLLRALRVPGKTVLSFPAYVPGASIVLLLGSGLVVDLAGPLVGVARPLSPEPLLVGVEIICLGLLAAGSRAGPETAIPWRSLSRPASRAWPLLAPLLLPALAAAGAARLNNGHGGAVAVIAVAACWLTLAATLACAAWLDTALLSVVGYAVALALMWGFSLRGDLVYGFDISAEYHAMQQTVQAGVWHTAHVGDAYGAMLSVTVLPATLHAIAGTSGLMVFKAVYPMISAIFPVVVFHLTGRVLSKGWAFAAAALVIVQQPYFQEFPGLARQEIAMVLFAVLVAAVVAVDLPRRAQLAMVVLLGLGMAVSHYSTTYFAIVMFLLALVLQWVVSWLRKTPRLSASLAVAGLTVAVGAAVWYGLVTRSASNLSQFVSAAQSQGFDLLPSSGGLLARYLQASSSTAVSAAEYARQVHLYYAANVPYVHPYPDASKPIYALQNSAGPSTPVRFQFGLSWLGRGELVVEQLMNLVAAVGALCIVLSRKSSALARQLGLLGLATLVILAALRFSGTAATAYNPERAFLQAFVVLGVGLCWVLQWLAGSSRRRRIAVLAVTVGAVAVVAANTTGLAGAAFGGGTDTNLANNGGDYDQFDMTAPELAAASWLGQQAQPGQLIYADRYAQLRLAAMIGGRPGELSDITPLTLNQQAWIYADRTNVTGDLGLAYFQNESAAYAFPFRFLRANYDLVYTAGSSEVFYR